MDLGDLFVVKYHILLIIIILIGFHEGTQICILQHSRGKIGLFWFISIHLQHLHVISI